MRTHLSTEHRGEEVSIKRLEGEVTADKAPWKRTRRKSLTGPGGQLNKTKPISFPESPPFGPIKELTLIRLMIYYKCSQITIAGSLRASGLRAVSVTHRSQ